MKIFFGVFFGIIAALLVLAFLISGAAYFDLRSQGYALDPQGNWHHEAVQR